MADETLDECKELLRLRDSTSLEERAKRLQEIEFGAVITDIQGEPPADRLNEYLREAADSYVNGNFRSCIFSSACIVDQVFKHEYVKASTDKKKALEEIKGKTFGKTLRLVCRLLSRELCYMKPFIAKATSLNIIRNGISVHPGYVDLPPSSEWGIVVELMRREILSLLKLLVITDPEIKPGEIEGTCEKILDDIKFRGERSYRDSQTFEVSLKDVLKKNFELDDVLVEPRQTRDVIEKDFLKPLALRSYRFMKEIVEGIYRV